MKSVSAIMIALSLIAASHQSPASQLCQPVQPAGVNTAWLDKLLETGFEVGIGSKLEPQLSTPKPRPEDKPLKQKRCFVLTMNLKLGSYEVPCICKSESDKLNEQYCELKTQGSPVQHVFNFNEKVLITKTDNQTYFVTYICTSEKIKYWNAYVPNGHVLAANTIQEIKDHVATLGASTEPEDMRSPDHDRVSHSKLRKVDCNSLGSGNKVNDVQNKANVDVPRKNVANKDEKLKSRANLVEDSFSMIG